MEILLNKYARASSLSRKKVKLFIVAGPQMLHAWRLPGPLYHTLYFHTRTPLRPPGLIPTKLLLI